MAIRQLKLDTTIVCCPLYGYDVIFSTYNINYPKFLRRYKITDYTDIEYNIKGVSYGAITKHFIYRR